jgi:methionyl-tRNA formyltransferase
MMTNEKTSLVFFGSGPVAAESLRLLAQNFDIEAIVTKPTTKAEMEAVLPELPLFTVANKTELDALFSEQNFSSKLGVLIDFGIIVSQKIIDYFPFGIINSHFSLLPELRGADPISFAILEGKNITGVSLMLLVEAMDEGPILTIGEEKLNGQETTPELTDKLIILSDALLKDSITEYLNNGIRPVDQKHIEKISNRKPSYTRKLTKKDGVIDWNKPALQLEREIRAYAAWPKSSTTLGDVEIIITKAYVVPSNSPKSKPGEIIYIPETKSLGVETGNGTLFVEKLKPAGKKEMNIESFINGYINKLNI